MVKRARIAVDCCGETLRIIWPLKAGFPCQSGGTFKQCTEEIYTHLDSGRFGFLYNLNEIRILGILELVSCDRVEWA